MKITLAMKKIGPENWEGAQIVDGKFQRAYVGTSADDIVTRGMIAALVLPQPEGTTIVVEAQITNGEPDGGSH